MLDRPIPTRASGDLDKMQVEQNQEARSMASFRIQLKKVQFCRFWVTPIFRKKKNKTNAGGAQGSMQLELR
jgi:hypothetical protein